MATMAREAWTDERLDDLKTGMHREFDQVHGEFKQVHTEIRELRAHTDAGFEAINARFDSLNRTMILSMGSIVVTLLGAIVTNAL